MTRVLVACEESGRVTAALRRNGIAAFSCDTLPTSGEHPEWHFQCDVLELAREKWDAVIAFPPCTHLAVSGACWFRQKERDGRQKEGIGFFLQFTKFGCPWAIENPVGIMSRHYRKPDQIIHPWQFGHPTEKRTCLWLSGFPLLKPTGIVDYTEYVLDTKGRREPLWHYKTGAGANSGVQRSKTFPGIAEAMGRQWGAWLKERYV
jgi:hypothetical protein